MLPRRALYGVPTTPLRAAIYRGLLLYRNRILNAFHPHVALGQRRVFQVETAVAGQLGQLGWLGRLMLAAGKIVACVQTEATKEGRDCEIEIVFLDRPPPISDERFPRMILARGRFSKCSLLYSICRFTDSYIFALGVFAKVYRTIRVASCPFEWTIIRQSRVSRLVATRQPRHASSMYM